MSARPYREKDAQAAVKATAAKATAAKATAAKATAAKATAAKATAAKATAAKATAAKATAAKATAAKSSTTPPPPTILPLHQYPFGMRSTTRNCLLAASNLLIPVAVLTFATGFFPYKPFVPGLGQYELSEYGDPPKSHFDKVIFMVVDALRSDFVYSANSGFKFTQSLIRSGAALPFTAHATSPTITMPRVKAITTGSIPSFLDVILNFAESDTSSSLANQDTWLAQIKNKNNGTLVMYGDDTWLKLFPDTFGRADGTSSFFVSDFTEVDNNVTRHVPHELRADDWDAMILHYLGLDHIGHKAGPLSPNMIPKQKEMDGIVEEMYQAMERFDHLNNTLLVMCGDHGMNDGGNHGGSAPGETSPALVFMSPKLKSLSSGLESPTLPRQDYEYYNLVEQSDIAPTLAGLLGFPIPQNNLGVFIVDFLPLWKSAVDRRNVLLGNALQVWKIVKATFANEILEEFDVADCGSAGSSGAQLGCLWQRATPFFPHGSQEGDDSSTTDVTLASLTSFTRRAQDVMSSTASNYNVSRLVSGIVLVTLSVILTSIIVLTKSTSMGIDNLFFLLITVLYGIMMFASSYVEEEQHFWYWITGGWIAYLALRKSQKLYIYAIGLLLCHRVTQRWNQTGQKFAGAPDIAHEVMLPYPSLLWILIAATYSILLYRIGNQVSYHLKAGVTVGTACALMLCIPAFAFKLGFTARDAPELLSWLGPSAISSLEQLPLIGSARLIFFTIGSETLWSFCSRFSSSNEERITRRDLISTIQTLFTLFLVTQTRATNIPLYIAFLLQDHFFKKLHLTPVQITIATLLLGQSSFFALGNSNAISSIDLSNAYNGISGFNVVGVGFLTFLSNWAGPVWWSITAIKMLVDTTSPLEEKEKLGNNKKNRDWVKQEFDNLLPAKPQQQIVPEAQKLSPFTDHIALLTLFTSASLLTVMVACTVLHVTQPAVAKEDGGNYLVNTGRETQQRKEPRGYKYASNPSRFSDHLTPKPRRRTHLPKYSKTNNHNKPNMAKLNGASKTPAGSPPRRNPTRGTAAKIAQVSSEDDDRMSGVEETVALPLAAKAKGKGKGKGATKAMPSPPIPVSGASEVEELSNAQENTAAVMEPAEDIVNVDENDAPKNPTKPKAAPKKPAAGPKTRGNALAKSGASEPMVVSVYKEDADVSEDDAPEVTVKPKAAAKKPQTMRKTRGQNVLSQTAEAGTQEEQEFYDAEEQHGKIKTKEMESGDEGEHVQEVVEPIKKAARGRRGRPAKKAVVDDDLMVVEAAKEPESPIKSKRGRRPAKTTQSSMIKQEEISDSEAEHATLDQKLATLSLGQMTLNSTDESVKPKPKTRGRTRKNTQTKKNSGSLDVSGLQLAMTYFGGIHDLAMGDVEEEGLQKILEMAQQGMDTIQAALDGVKEE
ncbi:GPI ethanolamine phosphate transferas-like protein 2 [Venturia nashicola]|nr:GPI ethanolamine phosphate transferas-like protein 2 [Venturia nashicola]